MGAVQERAEDPPNPIKAIGYNEVMATPRTRVRYTFVNMLTGSDLSRRRLPVMRASSVESGPVVWLTAGAHGEEVGGVVVIQEIFKKVRKAGLRRGTLCAFPLMNPMGLETASRGISFTGEDLNRCFPGSPSGSLGERIADRIFAGIMETGPSLVLDLHNDWIKSIPYAVLDLRPEGVSSEVYEQTADFAKLSQFLVIRETEHVHSTLTCAMLQRGVPAVTLELGESYTVNEKHTETGVRAVWRILAHLGMAEPPDDEEPPASQPVENPIWTYYDRPYSSTSGIARFLVRPGQSVRKGQPIARSYNAFGKVQETLCALQDGIVLGYSDSCVVFPGMRIMAFAVMGPCSSPPRAPMG